MVAATPESNQRFPMTRLQRLYSRLVKISPRGCHKPQSKVVGIVCISTRAEDSPLLSRHGPKAVEMGSLAD